MEIMLVVMIIGILVGLAINRLGGAAEAAKVVGARTSISGMKGALYAYRAVNGAYPTTGQGLKALFERPSMEPIPANWRRVGEGNELPKDPWGFDFVYSNPGKKNPTGFDIYSVGPDGAPDTEDDVWQN